MSISFEDLRYETLTSIENIDDEYLILTLDTGERYQLGNSPSFNNVSVTIEDINGRLADLIGSPLTMVEESISDESPEDEEETDNYTLWTYYRLATVKGYVTIRWYGESNGWYSMSVGFRKLAN